MNIENRLLKLEGRVKTKPQTESSKGLDKLSVPELKELEAMIIKVEAREELTEAEEQRAAAIMKITKGR